MAFDLDGQDSDSVFLLLVSLVGSKLSFKALRGQGHRLVALFLYLFLLGCIFCYV